MAREFENEKYNVHTSDTVIRGIGSTLKRISWGAVFAGFVVAVVLQFALNLLGLAIGFAAINPTQQMNPFEGLGTGSLIYMILTVLISLFVGGWIAGRLSTIKNTFENVIHGVLAFCLFALFNFYMVTSMIGGALSGLGNVAGMAMNSQGMGQINLQGSEMAGTGQNTLDIIEERNPAYHPEYLDESMADADEGGHAFNKAFDKLMQNGKVDAEARQNAINEIKENTDLTRQEATDVVDSWVASYQQAEQQPQAGQQEQYEQRAREVGEDVAKGISRASIFAFIGMVLGAGAAGFGGKVGVSREPLVKDVEI